MHSIFFDWVIYFLVSTIIIIIFTFIFDKVIKSKNLILTEQVLIKIIFLFLISIIIGGVFWMINIWIALCFMSMSLAFLFALNFNSSKYIKK